MNTQNFISGIKGCAQGYFFSQQALEKESFAGPGNSYNTILPRMLGMSQLAIMGLHINAAVPRPSQAFVNKTLRYMPWISVAIASAVAYIREGDYPGPALSPLTRKACCFLAENWDEMSIVAMGVGAMGCAILGNPVYGASILAALSYNVLDQRGYVDERISKFVMKFMPTLSSAVIVATHGLSLSGFIAAWQLAKILLPTSQNTALQYKVDHLLRRIFGSPDMPSLEALEGALKLDIPWGFGDINRVLDTPTDGFELNPAHLSKPLQAYVDFPEDHKFSEKIPALFDHIIWDNDLVLAVLKQNDCFLNFMTQKLPNVDRRDMKQTPVAVLSTDGTLQENMDQHKRLRQYIAQVVQQTKPNMTAKEFINDWIRTRIIKIAARIEEDLAPDALQSVIETKKLCAQLFWCIPLLNTEEQTKVLLTLALGAENASWVQIEQVAAVVIEHLLENEETRNAVIQDPVVKATVIAINKYKQIRKDLLQQTLLGVMPFIQAGIYPIAQPIRRSLTVFQLIFGVEVGSSTRQEIYTKYNHEVFNPWKLKEYWSQDEITSWLLLLFHTLPDPVNSGPYIANAIQKGEQLAFRNAILYRLGILRFKNLQL